MRPYLAIIRDSFHEALASRVLWILLAVSTLLLVLLMPLGILEQAGSVLRDEDLFTPSQLADKIVAQGTNASPSPGRSIWKLLDTTTREVLQSKPDGDKPFEARQREHRLERALQQLLAERNLYDGENWKNVSLPAPARELLERGIDTLAEDELARFNRLALEAAYPDQIAPTVAHQVQLAYFHWELGLPLPVAREQLFPAINRLVVTALGMVLGVAGVFVAVLVTASMIPQAFESGSVDLLLSKPISRSLLFLSKFVGGCAFTAINAAYLIGGLWLVLGWRFGLWNARLLWAIPLYLFLFAIYYGVSALTGVVGRNAILSVVMAILFWFICWTLGTANTLVETLALAPRRLLTVTQAGDALIASSPSTVVRWDEEKHDWQPIFAPRSDRAMPFMLIPQLVGPVYDPVGQRIVAFHTALPGFAALRGANRLLIGRAAEDWRRTEGVTVPDGAAAVFIGGQGQILIAGSQGVSRLQGDVMARQQDVNVFGLHIPLPEQGGRFVSVGPKLQLRPLQGAALDPVSQAVALFDGYRLVRLNRNDQGMYVLAAEREFDTKLEGKVALAGDTLYLALADGELRRFDASLEPIEPLASSSRVAADTLAVSPNGRYLAIVYHDGRLWLYDTLEDAQVSLPLVGQGDISTIAWTDSDLLAVDRLTRVTKYQLAGKQLSQSWQPPMPVAERIYRYVLHPLYTVFPKPGQLNDTVNYVLTPQEKTLGAVRIENQEVRAQPVDVWGPVWSNLAFLAVVLAIACLYVHRTDF